MDTTDDNAPLRWTLTRNAPLQALNTFHVQANAEQLLELHDAALLPEVLALPEVGNGPLLVLGSGSNVSSRGAAAISSRQTARILA